MDGAANGPQSHLRDDPGGAAPESAPNVRITTLANGLRVVTEAMPHLQSAALGVWIGAGARAEHSHESGIAHMLEHMAFKGTERRTAQGIAEEIEAVGGDLNAMTSFETTAYYARVLADDVPLAIDILGDILINSRFDPAELERERGVILQEIRAAHDTPDDLVFDLAQRAAFGDQPLGRPILGTTESVSGFQSADLQSYLGRMYGPDRMILAAAGAVEHDAVVALAESTFESRPVPEDTPLAPAHFQGGFEGVARDLEQVHLVKGFEGWSYRSPDIYAAQVLAGVLGGGMSSRLFQEAREKRGLCYSIYAYHWSISDAGFFGIYAATDADHMADLCAVIDETLARSAKDVSDAEVARARAQIKAGLLMSLESPSSRIEQIARQCAVFGRVMTSEELAAHVDAVTPEKVRALAGRLVASRNPAIAAVGPESGLAVLRTMSDQAAGG